MVSQVQWRSLVVEYLSEQLYGNRAPKYLKIWPQVTKILRCLKREEIFPFGIWVIFHAMYLEFLSAFLSPGNNSGYLNSVQLATGLFTETGNEKECQTSYLRN